MSERKYFAAVVAVVVGVVAMSGQASADTGGPAIVSASSLGVSSSLSVPWRVEVLADGSQVSTFGPGTADVPLQAGTREMAISGKSALPGSAGPDPARVLVRQVIVVWMAAVFGP